MNCYLRTPWENTGHSGLHTRGVCSRDTNGIWRILGTLNDITLGCDFDFSFFFFVISPLATLPDWWYKKLVMIWVFFAYKPCFVSCSIKRYAAWGLTQPIFNMIKHLGTCLPCKDLIQHLSADTLSFLWRQYANITMAPCLHSLLITAASLLFTSCRELPTLVLVINFQVSTWSNNE